MIVTAEFTETENDVTKLTEGECMPCKKPKLNMLEKLLRKQFDSVSIAYRAATVSSSEITQAEIRGYKGILVISLRDKPLQWWNLNKYILPNLSILAQKYLSIVAPSVPMEQLFSVAGNILVAKRVAFLPENVRKLVFLLENMSTFLLTFCCLN